MSSPSLYNYLGGGVGITTQFLVVSYMIQQSFYKHQSIITKDEYLTDTYDYIVVGSGSAGAIVAHRLAEDKKTRVILLEAGPPGSVHTDIPGAASLHQLFNTQFDWNYTMEEQPVGKAFLNGRIPENRGFALGGSTSINTLIYNRGNRRDYDSWVKDYGAVGWSYDEVMPYFLKFEGNRDPEIVAQNPKFHSTTGPIGITSFENPDPLLVINIIALNKEAGVPFTDINGPNQVGTMLAQAFIEQNGIRSSTSNSYLMPNPFPENLHILTGALVTKILFDNKTAVGVHYEHKGHEYKVMAKKEIIISAGAINSPQLLMLSGIGPKEELDYFNIPLVEDLPVGDNYHNHAGIDFNFLIKEKSLHLTNIPSQLSAPHLYEWFTKGTGPLAQYYRSVTYFSTKGNKDKEWPNVSLENAIWQFPQNLSDFRFYQFGERAHEWAEYLKPYLGRMFLFVHPIIQRVKSRGYVSLASNDPHIPPLINPRYMTNEVDYQAEIDMIRSVLQFYELSSMSEHLEPLKPIPGCSLCPDKKYMFECESYIRCTIEQILYTTYHGVGTCRMGDPKREDTVLDSELRVKGINNLRVCDLSIVPLLPNANTNACALMIGEKCADLVKNQDH